MPPKGAQPGPASMALRWRWRRTVTVVSWDKKVAAAGGRDTSITALFVEQLWLVVFS